MSKRILITSAIAFAMLLLCVVVIFFAAFNRFYSSNYVPTPEITYGEFPCVLTYEVDGEVKTIKDTIICEFDGIETVHGTEKRRKWKTYLKSGNESMVLLDVSSRNEKDIFGCTPLEFFFSYGDAEYYMGDIFNQSIPGISEAIEYKYRDENGNICESEYLYIVAMEEYKLRLISWEVAPPIKNYFR